MKRTATECKTLLGLGTMMLVVVATGCMTIDMDIAVKPDLAMQVGMKFTAPLELADQTEGFGELPGMDHVTVEQDATTRSVSGIQMVAPDEDFALDGEPGPTVLRQTSEHRLSTHYVFAMDLAEARQLAQAEPPALGEDDQGHEQLAAMMSGLMSTFKINVTVHLPGQIVSTNGTVVDEGTVSFPLTMQELAGGDAIALTAVSRLPNYTHLGRLSDQLVAAGTDCTMAERLPMYLQDGLLPDPPVDADARYRLDVADYARLVELIAALDEELPGEMTVAVVGQLGLNSDNTTPEQIAHAADAAQRVDLRELMLQAVLSGLQD